MGVQTRANMMKLISTLALVAVASAQYAPAPVVKVVKEIPQPYAYEYGVADDYSKANCEVNRSHDKVSKKSTALFRPFRPFSAIDGTFGKLQWADGTFAHTLGKVNGSHDKVSKKSTVLYRPFRPFSALDGALGKLQWADGTFAHALGKVNGSHDKVSKKSTALFRPFRLFSALDGALGKL